jgi:hypothetical protein
MQFGSAKKEKKKKEQIEVDITHNLDKSVSYFPIVYKTKAIKDSIFDYKISPIFSTNSPMPRFDLGFNFYAHSTKDKMEIIPTLPTKRKFYYITNSFEHFIDGAPEKSIATYATKYFDLSDKKEEILSRGFFKLWEILLMFDLVQHI